MLRSAATRNVLNWWIATWISCQSSRSGVRCAVRCRTTPPRIAVVLRGRRLLGGRRADRGAHAAASEKELAARRGRTRGGTMRCCRRCAATSSRRTAASRRRRRSDVGARRGARPRVDRLSCRGAVASRKGAAARAAHARLRDSVAAGGRPAQLAAPPRRPTEPAKEAPRLSSRPGAEQFKAPEKGSGGWRRRAQGGEAGDDSGGIRAAKWNGAARGAQALAALKGSSRGATTLRQCGERHRPPAGARARRVPAPLPPPPAAHRPLSPQVHPDRLGAMTTAVRATLPGRAAAAAGQGRPRRGGRGGAAARGRRRRSGSASARRRSTGESGRCSPTSPRR